MADLSELNSSQSVKIAGASSTGAETNFVNADSNGQLFSKDIINIAGQNRSQSVTTSPAEALGAATILTNRKFVSITPTNGTVYWGFTSGVTTSNGTPIFKNQTLTLSFGDNVHVYLVAATTIDCRISEGS